MCLSFYWCCHHCQGEVTNTFNDWWCMTDQTMRWREPFLWHFEMHKAFSMCTWTRWHWGIHTAAPWHCSICRKPSRWNAIACTQRKWNLSMMVLPLVQLMLIPVLVAVTLGMPCPFTTQPDLCAWWIFWGHQTSALRENTGMKVAETSALWELHNESIVWAISHLLSWLCWYE
jgi:hypothetical protein